MEHAWSSLISGHNKWNALLPLLILALRLHYEQSNEPPIFSDYKCKKVKAGKKGRMDFDALGIIHFTVSHFIAALLHAGALSPTDTCHVTGQKDTI